MFTSQHSAYRLRTFYVTEVRASSFTNSMFTIKRKKKQPWKSVHEQFYPLYALFLSFNIKFSSFVMLEVVWRQKGEKSLLNFVAFESITFQALPINRRKQHPIDLIMTWSIFGRDFFVEHTFHIFLQSRLWVSSKFPVSMSRFKLGSTKSKIEWIQLEKLVDRLIVILSFFWNMLSFNFITFE